MNLSRIFSILDKTISGIKIVILDACRNNPFNSFVRSPQLGLAQMNAPTGTYISYSTAPGSVALDGTADGYGYFTGSLVNAINTPGLTIEEVFKKTRLSVISLTDGQQIPWEASSLLGDFTSKRKLKLFCNKFGLTSLCLVTTEYLYDNICNTTRIGPR